MTTTSVGTRDDNFGASIMDAGLPLTHVPLVPCAGTLCTNHHSVSRQLVALRFLAEEPRAIVHSLPPSRLPGTCEPNILRCLALTGRL